MCSRVSLHLAVAHAEEAPDRKHEMLCVLRLQYKCLVLIYHKDRKLN